jgi:hypothetical protein
VDAAVVDFSLPDGDGLDVLRSVKAQDASVPVVLLTGHGSIDLAVKAIKEGAEQFFTKPVELPALLVVIERALENRRMRQVSLAGKSVQARQTVDPFFGESAVIRKLAADAARIVASTVPVLICGRRDGEGRARALAPPERPRAEEAFVDLNCAGLSRDLLETELFGTRRARSRERWRPSRACWRSPIGDDVPGRDRGRRPAGAGQAAEGRGGPALPAARGRARPPGGRAAPGRDPPRPRPPRPGTEVPRGPLLPAQHDPLVVPPLRERGSDVILLARRLVERISAEMGRPGVRLSGAAEQELLSRSWPGNVRQLRNVLERALLLSDHSTLGPADVADASPAAARPPPAARRAITLAEAERRHIEAVLREERGRWRRRRKCSASRAARSTSGSRSSASSPPRGRRASLRRASGFPDGASRNPDARPPATPFPPTNSNAHAT